VKSNGLTKHIPTRVDFISIDQNICNRCGLCILVCVANLWRKIDKIISISEDYKERCLECAACYQVCEAGAIEFRYPPGGTGIIYEKG
jgi:ferredoxin like protein